MYAIKGGWIGQTFALATCNDSGGRKARIRRSKEERKAMVESFIKTYQMSNDGKFPSLNLTHKEVGGSFYTVREIVRDVIQENRVLGPAKFNADNQKLNGNTRESPNESASMESDDYLFQLENENIALSDQHASTIVEMNMNGNEQYAKYETMDAGEFIGNTEIEESEKLVYVDALLNGSICNSKEIELVYGSTVEECDEEVSTQSSVSESFVVKQEAELEVTDSSENANLEDLDADQLVFVKESDESSVSESFVVEQEAELEVTGCSENANLKEKLNLEDAEQLVNGSTVEEYDKVVSTESSVGDSVIVEQSADVEVIGCSENANLKVKLNCNEEKTKHDVLDFGKYVNGSEVEESDKIKSLEPSLIQKHDVGRNSGSVEAKTNKLSPTENIAVETFPLRSVTNGSYTVDTASVNSALPVVQKAVNDPQASSSNGRHAMVHETTSKITSDLMEVEESSRSGEGTDIETHNHNNPITVSHDESALLKAVDDSEEITGVKVTDDTAFPNSYEVKFTNYSMELEAEKTTTSGSTKEKPRENKALKASKPTLDRINLGSWEGTSKKSLEHEKNPLFIFLKSLVSAVVKFLSD